MLDANGKLPSGTNKDDLHHHALRGVHVPYEMCEEENSGDLHTEEDDTVTVSNSTSNNGVDDVLTADVRMVLIGPRKCGFRFRFCVPIGCAERKTSKT